ncbi:MAG TPA: hypothetical protein VNW92_16105 [Polyangiaceae bacterium]|jgi:hypothetical protein|nr:hypothetical protein [Polyangiaceae bacterium]
MFGAVEADARTCCPPGVKVEFLDGEGQWQPLENASAVRVQSGVYEVTLSEMSYMWQVPKDLFEGTLLRVDGRETNEVVGIRRERSLVVLKATTKPSRP